MNWNACVAVALLSSAGAIDAAAHPGGVDAKGCHVESATGERHCHRVTFEGWLNDEEVRALQRKLKAQGHYTGAIDGKFGERTLAALRNYLDETRMLD